ncbi:MAG: hypothetical protein HY074_20290 [Deltaproteobacteria bacterium]|nr:hypothetical protein [Deltaproteobacteria bacterium]
MRRLPASPSRTQSNNEFEPVLLEQFQALTAHVSAEMRDSMHYALFCTEDRYCVSAAWLVAPRLKISTARLKNAACAVETLRCSLALKTGSNFGSGKYVEPAIAEAAVFGLMPLAFEMLLAADSALSDSERCALARLLARSASPVELLEAIHRENKMSRDGYRHSFSHQELQEVRLAKVSPAFQAAGEMLALLSGDASKAPLGPWFKKLGLFAFWVDEFESEARSPLALRSVMSLPESMDLVKSLEAELLERARELGIRDAAHELIEPLADVLKTRLQ